MPVFTLSIVVILISVFLFWKISREFGDIPSGDRLKRIEASPQFDKIKGTFKNEVATDFRGEMPVFAMLKALVFGGQTRTPTQPLPSAEPDLAVFLATTADAPATRLIWLGHSTVLLNIGGKILLLDPTMTARVSPVRFFGNRFQPPALKLEDLPPIDFLVVSHDHYDHLDADSIRFFAKPENSRSRVVTALGVGARLESFGIAKDRIVELDWWEDFEQDGFKFTATPSQHFSGRGLTDNTKTLWAGIAIRHNLINFFFSGDSGYHTHFKKIGERLGPFDFAVLESGQYNVWWRFVHMLPEEVVQAAQDIRTKEFMPIHWGMYNLALHDWFEPIARVFEYAQKKTQMIRTPILGEITGLKNDAIQIPPRQERWWEKHADFAARRDL